MVQVTDSLLPQIAADLDVPVGAASFVVSAYEVAHGSVQLVIGPIGDRFGKYLSIAVGCAISTLLVLFCGLAQSLPALVAARLACGFSAGWIIPPAMAFIGDVIPYERRQPILARFFSGQILGMLFGQAAGGVLGDLLGWRRVFFFLAGLFAFATAVVMIELWRNPLMHAASLPRERTRGLRVDYSTVLGNRWARIVCGQRLRGRSWVRATRDRAHRRSVRQISLHRGRLRHFHAARPALRTCSIVALAYRR